MTKICCVCKCSLDGSVKKPVAEREKAFVSHGFCIPCYSAYLDRVLRGFSLRQVSVG